MKTPPEDFEAFKKEFVRWQRLLGLSEWRVCFTHAPCEGRSYAEISCDPTGRVATVWFEKHIEKDGLIGYDPINSGRHEALELLLGNLVDLARSRYTSWTEIDEAKHAIIRRLESMLDEDDGSGACRKEGNEGLSDH